jgi:hypothetical protein
MEIRVDGNRSSAENWTRAQTASVQELPSLSQAQKSVAAKLGLKDEDYARSVLAGDLERKDLEKRAEQAAQVIERLTPRNIAGLRVNSVWLKTFDGKSRFDVDFNESHTLVFVAEDLINELLETGSKLAEERIARIIDLSLPTAWATRAS